MFDLSIQQLDLQKENAILKKNINLDTNLDCFILVSSKDSVLADNILNNAIENIIDKISKEDTYNDFGIALENINSFLKTWRNSNKEEDKQAGKRLDMIICILNENNFMFSNIGKTGAYMINSNAEVIELTEKGENKKDFLYISSGNLTNGDIIISSTLNLLKHLSKSDLQDGIILADDMDIFGKNIKNILKTEILKKNVLVASMKYENELVGVDEDSKLKYVKGTVLGLADTKIVKKIVGTSLMIKDKINLQSKNTRNIIFIFVIVLAIILLYGIVSKMAAQITQTEIKKETKVSILEIRKVLQQASENVSNSDSEIFRVNIKKAEKMVEDIESKNLFQGDIAQINDEIAILKNQYNKVEIFEETKENSVYAESLKQVVGVTKSKGKLYIIKKQGLVGPIVDGIEPKVYIASDKLKGDEYFVDYGFIGKDIYFLTNTSKIVKFSSGRFSFANVSGQDSWENMKTIDTYSSNLYTLGTDNQIYKHRALAREFSEKTGYLKEGDKKEIGEILDFAIDGGFYILKKDLSVVKFFSSPYRIEPLTLSKLPKNYKIEEGSTTKIKAGFRLKYVYMLINDKIWIFKTNSNNYQKTRDLAFMGQVEGGTNKIIDFHVESDGEIFVVSEKGISKLKFEVSDDKIILR